MSSMRFFRAIQGFQVGHHSVIKYQLFACRFNDEYELPIPIGELFGDYYEEVQL